MTEQKLPPIHPGEILMEEFLKPLGLSQLETEKDRFADRLLNEVAMYKAA